MEGARLDCGNPEVAQPRAHLARRAMREGDGEDVSRRVLTRMYSVGDAVMARVLPVPAPASTAIGPATALRYFALARIEMFE